MIIYYYITHQARIQDLKCEGIIVKPVKMCNTSSLTVCEIYWQSSYNGNMQCDRPDVIPVSPLC